MTAPRGRWTRGSYRRPPEWPWRLGVGWVRTSGHISGVWITLGRPGWYLNRLRATPCRHQRRLEELQQRVDRTVTYFDELLTGPLDPATRVAAGAARRSLLTAIETGDRS